MAEEPYQHDKTGLDPTLKLKCFNSMSKYQLVKATESNSNLERNNFLKHDLVQVKVSDERNSVFSASDYSCHGDCNNYEKLRELTIQNLKRNKMHLLKAWLDAKKGKHQDYDNLVSKLLSGSEITYCDLDFVLLLLCLILLRPIIVYSCQDDYASALFLPYLLPQFECSFNPCMLLFSNGTFSALLCKPDKDRVPLVDQELKRLRIPFFGPKTGHELMKEYLRLSEYDFNGTKIPAARIVDIFGTKVIDNLHKTEIEDLYSKTFNPEFDDHTTVKTLVEHHHRKSFSDDGIQYHDNFIRRENENILPSINSLASTDCAREQLILYNNPRSMALSPHNGVMSPYPVGMSPPLHVKTPVPNAMSPGPDAVATNRDQEGVILTKEPSVLQESCKLNQVTDISTRYNNMEGQFILPTENGTVLVIGEGSSVTVKPSLVTITQVNRVILFKCVLEWGVNVNLKTSKLYKIAIELCQDDDEGDITTLKLAKPREVSITVTRLPRWDIMFGLELDYLKPVLNIALPINCRLQKHNEVNQDWLDVLNDIDGEDMVQLSSHKDKCRVDGCMRRATSKLGLCKTCEKTFSENEIFVSNVTSLRSNLSSSSSFGGGFRCRCGSCSNMAAMNDSGLCTECFNRHESY